jgi:hypothetical protein
MIPFTSAVRHGLTWSKIPHTHDYELKLNGEIAGVLARPSCWSPRFLAETPGGCWAFRRQGFLGTGVEITDADSGQTIASFQSSCCGGGTLIFADGQTFHLKYKGWWRPVWTMTTDDDKPMLHLHAREKTVELPVSAAIPPVPLCLLIMFAWSRVLQADEDASAAAVTAAAA